MQEKLSNTEKNRKRIRKMAKLYYRYGAMGSSKSANILMVRYNYEEREQYAVLLKPKVDNRDGERVIQSRIGLSAPAGYVDEFLEEIADVWKKEDEEHFYHGQKVDAVLVDEAQFLTPEEVDILSDLVDFYEINLEGNRGPIYNVVHQLKKKGKIEANGIGEYRICKQSVEPVKKGRMEFSNKQKNQLEVSIGNIEMYVDKYKKFDWINCSDEELQDARSNVTRLLDLAKKVEKEFKKI